jgi:xanthosine phosphorylase
MSDIQKSKDIIKDKAAGLSPKIAVMLGSGLGAVSDLMEVKASISYSDLPGFPLPTVAGHEGSFQIGTINGVATYFLKGRQHLYEGEGTEGLKNIIRTLKSLNIDALFLTNAAGSTREDYPPGTVVAITDHINLTGTNPLMGQNDDDWGPRFPPMDNAWDKDLRDLLLNSGNNAGVNVGSGVYACFLGPNFETPAEVLMAKKMGADLVGMSTVPENIIARHCNLKCIGVSAVTNLAEGLSETPLSHEQTLEGAKLAEKNMAKLVEAFISEYDKNYKDEAA